MAKNMTTSSVSSYSPSTMAEESEKYESDSCETRLNIVSVVNEKSANEEEDFLKKNALELFCQRLGGYILKFSYAIDHRHIFDIMQHHNNVVVLEIDCTNYQLDSILQNEFHDILKKMNDLVVVDIIVSDDMQVAQENLSDFIEFVERPLILQCRSQTNTIIYYKNLRNNITKSDLSLDEYTDVDKKQFYEMSKNHVFDLDLLINGVKLKIFGELGNSGLRKSLLDANFNEWQLLALICISIKHNNILTLKFLLLFSDKISGDKLGVDCLMQLTSVKSSISKECKLASEKANAALQEAFANAIENGDLTIVTFLIAVNCVNVNCRKSFMSMADIACKNQQYHILLTLLEADSDFPSRNLFSKVSDENIRKFVASRNMLHEMVKNGNEESINYIESLEKSSLYLNQNNESLLLTAVQNGHYKMYIALTSKGLKFKDKIEALVINEMSSSEKEKLKIAIDNTSGKPKDAAVLYLLSKSMKSKGEMDDESRNKIKRFYEELLNIETVDTIFSVIENCDYLSIIYDFDNSSVCHMNPNVSGNVKGLTCYTEGRIYIGAMTDVIHLLGTIVHELTHLAMQIVYENDCDPFAKTDDEQKAVMEKITLDFSKNWQIESQKMDAIWAGVFMDGQSYWSRELIARVPQMLTIHFDGVDQLNEQAKELFVFYMNVVIPQCKSFVNDSYFLKIRSYISFLNCSSNVLNVIQDLDVGFVNPLDVLIVGDRKPLKVLTTKSTLLTLISVFQSLKVAVPNSFLIFNFKRYLKSKSDVHEALKFEICKVLVLEVTAQEKYEKIPLAIDALLKLLTNHSTKTVVIIEHFNNQQIEPELTRLGRRAVTKWHKHVVEEDYSLNDFDKRSQTLLLKKDVEFQGCMVQLNTVVTDEKAFGVVDSETLVKLLKNKPIKIGKKPSIATDFDEAFYIKRNFTFSDIDIEKRTSLDKDERMTEDELLHKIKDSRIVLLSDVAGMGKTTVLTRMSMLIHNHWIIRIDLNQFLKDMRVEHNRRSFNAENVGSALQFLTQVLLKGSLETAFEKNLLNHCIQFQENVIVMFDGFDEICPDYKQIVIELLVALAKTKIKQLWVSTRSHMKKALEESLQIKSLLMIPFTYDDKINFLKRFWVATCKLNKNDAESKLNVYAEALLSSISSSIFDDKSFTEIPLQLRLLAEVHKGSFMSFLQEEAATPNIENIGLIDIYQRFIKEKYDIYFKEKTHIDHCLDSFLIEQENDFDKSHQLLALGLIFPNEDVVQNYMAKKQISENKLITAKSIGIVKSFDGNTNIYFVHRTFAEYFIANFIVGILCGSKNSVEKYQLAKTIWAKISVDSDYFSINKFINLFTTSHLSLHRTVILYDDQRLSHLITNENVNINEVDRLGRTALYLACSLKYEFGVKQLLLTKCCNVNNSDILGRTVLHYAAAFGSEINVEMVLHEVVDFHIGDNIFSKPLLANSEVSDCIFNQPYQLQSKLLMLVNHKDEFDQSALCYAALNQHESVTFILISMGAVVSNAILQHPKWMMELVSDFFESIEFSITKFEIVGLLLVVFAAHGSFDDLSKLPLKAPILKRFFESGHIKVIKCLETLCAETMKIVMTKNLGLIFLNSINRYCNMNDVGYLATVQHFVQSNLIPENSKSNFIRHAIESCGRLGFVETLKFLISHYFADMKNVFRLCFYEAVNNSQLAVIEFLWKNSSQDVLYNNLGSPLHYSCNIGNINVVKFLCENGANVNDQNNAQQCPPINYAVMNGHLNIVRYLISNGANIKAEDVYKHNALYDAICYQQCHVIEFLMPEFDLSTDIGDRLNNIWKIMKENGTDVINFRNENGVTLLHMLAELRMPNLIKWLITKGADVNCKDNQGRSPIHYACYKAHQCNIDCMEVTLNLFEAGAVYNSKDNNGVTALHMVPQDKEVRDHCLIYLLRVIDHLFIYLKSGIGNLDTLKVSLHSIKELTALNARDTDGNTILHMIRPYNHDDFINLNINLALLKNKLGISINAQNKDGNSPLHVAAECNHYRLVEMLCEHGAMINLPNLKQQTPLMLSQGEYVLEALNEIEHLLSMMRNNCIKVTMKHILDCRKAFVYNAKDLEGKTALHLAVINEWNDISEYLINAVCYKQPEYIKERDINSNINVTDIFKRTPLHYAAIKGNANIINLLIKHNCCFNLKDVDGKVPHDLLETSNVNNALTLTTSLFNAIHGDLQLVLNLLQTDTTEDLLKIAVRAVDASGNRLLYYACLSGNIQIVKLLLNNGADVRGLCQSKTFALFNTDVKKCISVLDPVFYQRKTSINMSELMFHSDSLSLIINARGMDGLNVLHLSSRYPPFIFKDLIQKGADVNAVDNYGESPLHRAVLSRDLKLVSTLVGCGANVNAKDVNGATPMMKCESIDFYIFKFLISSGADINAQDIEGKTCLIRAVIEGFVSIVTLLLDSNADITVTDIYGKSAMDYALEWNSRRDNKVLKVLASRGANAVESL